MMQQGIQRVGRRALLALLRQARQARQELEAELQFASTSAEQFIERIEYRSSLIMQTGYELIDGELQEVYEFRHLTFQEYLAARGFVEEQYPGRAAETPLADLLAPHFEDERWRELVPLAAALAGRRCEGLIQRLTDACAAIELEEVYPTGSPGAPAVVLLRQCLLDEVPLTTASLREALLQTARHGDEAYFSGSVLALLSGKYGVLFRDVAETAYLSGQGRWWKLISAVADISLVSLGLDNSSVLTPNLADSLMQSLTSVGRIERVRAALAIMHLAFLFSQQRDLTITTSPVTDLFSPAITTPPAAELFSPLRDPLSSLVTLDDRPVVLAATWAMIWLGEGRLPSTPAAESLLTALYRVMRTAGSDLERHWAAWAFSVQPLLPRDRFTPDSWPDVAPFFAALNARLAAVSQYFQQAALVLAWYRREPWSDAEIAARLRAVPLYDVFRLNAREILATLGEPGQQVLDEWAKEESANAATRKAPAH